MRESLEELIIENANLIYKIANMFRNSGNDMEDLKQVGKMGFIEAYQHFNPEHGVKFTTYAYPYIYGAISKYVRENKGVKISRELTKLYYKIEKASLLLMQRLYREPTTLELANELGIDEAIINEALLSKNTIHSIDEPVGTKDKELTLHEVICDSSIVDIDDKILLEEALNDLTEEEYQLVENRYMKDLTQTEVANMLHTSQVQVSRKEQKVMKKLRSLCFKSPWC